MLPRKQESRGCSMLTNLADFAEIEKCIEQRVAPPEDLRSAPWLYGCAVTSGQERGHTNDLRDPAPRSGLSEEDNLAQLGIGGASQEGNEETTLSVGLWRIPHAFWHGDQGLRNCSVM
jgi:hypothetical protein